MEVSRRIMQMQHCRIFAICQPVKAMAVTYLCWHCRSDCDPELGFQRLADGKQRRFIEQAGEQAYGVRHLVHVAVELLDTAVAAERNRLARRGGHQPGGQAQAGMAGEIGYAEHAKTRTDDDVGLPEALVHRLHDQAAEAVELDVIDR
jgi:hypothetical protein